MEIHHGANLTFCQERCLAIMACDAINFKTPGHCELRFCRLAEVPKPDLPRPGYQGFQRLGRKPKWQKFPNFFNPNHCRALIIFPRATLISCKKLCDRSHDCHAINYWDYQHVWGNTGKCSLRSCTNGVVPVPTLRPRRWGPKVSGYSRLVGRHSGRIQDPWIMSGEASGIRSKYLRYVKLVLTS